MISPVPPAGHATALSSLSRYLLLPARHTVLRARHVWPLWLPPVFAPLLVLLAGHILVDGGLHAPLLFFSTLLFAFFAVFLHRWAALGAAIGVESLLNSINTIKQAMTDEPIVARDLIAISQGTSLTSYLSGELLLWVLLTLVSITAGLYFRPRFNGWRSIAGLILPMMLLIRLFAPASMARYQAVFVENGIGANYLSYNFKENIRQNGVLAHLFLTAESVEIPKPGPHDFYAIAPLTPTGTTVQPDIVMILCEACFSSRDDRFVTPIARLARSGFEQTTVISPVYGGGTAEAEFEYLSGLPSTVLPGIDYQNFVTAYRADARTLVSKLAHAGYRTIGMHNFHANFWKRNEVYPKFGFQEMHFIDEMRWEKPGWPDDALMYHKAQQVYRQQPRDGRTFMFLVTVHTHGAYVDRNGDGGRGDYEQRLGQAVDDLQQFVKSVEGQAKKRKRDVMFILVGDHKPSLSKAFFEAGVFDQSYFRSLDGKGGYQFALKLSPEQQAHRGEVPLFIRYAAEPQRAASMGKMLDGRPMFCVPAAITQQLPQRGIYFDTLAARCGNPPEQLTAEAAQGWQKEFPRALFAERLF